MTITGRLRFEILRRDNYSCHYCGASAPDVKITVDHVLPRALGGTNDPSNLVAACSKCNAGKSSVPPDAPTVTAADSLNTRWRDAVARAQTELDAESPRHRSEPKEFDYAWARWRFDSDGTEVPRHAGWAASVLAWIDCGLTIDMLIDLIPVAMAKDTGDTWRYFCGCAWRRVREVTERAEQLLAEQAAIEAACALADQAEAEADLAHRSERLKQSVLDEPTSIGTVLRLLAEKGTDGT